MPSGLQFTAIYVQGDTFIVAFVEEFPNIVTQGKTLEQARARVIEAVQLMLEMAREEAEECTAGKRVLLRETLDIGDSKVDG